MDLSERYKQAKRVTLLGLAKNSFLSFIKILFGYTGHSHALVADGVHSLSDLLIDSLILVATRFGSKAADQEHPYGHGRIETAATAVLAFIMSLAGIGIIVDACMEIFGRRSITKPNFYVLLVALISVLANEVLYLYTKFIGRRVQSNLLLANAWHHRSDSASSLVVFVGVLGTWLGFITLDLIAAIVVGLLIIKMAWQFGLSSFQELIDTGLKEEMLTEINQCITGVAGVQAVHQLRTRSVGGQIFLDVHIMVDPTISVSEGHYIGQQVHFCLLKQIPEIADVTLHVDPEDDEVVAPSRDLPNRHQIIALLQARWRNLIPDFAIQSVVLHYLAGKVSLELRLPLDLLQRDSAADLKQQLHQKIRDLDIIDSIDIVYK